MKKVILCEGKNDKIFVSELLNRRGYHSSKVKIFDSQEIDKDKVGAESRVIKNFVKGKIPYSPDILVKAECGKQFALKVFSREFSTFIHEIKDTTLILDTDSKDFDETIKWVENFLLIKFSGNKFEINTERIFEEEKIMYAKMNFFIMGMKKGFAHLIMIKKSLEDVCNIDSTDKDNQKLDKIKEFLNGNNLKEFFPFL